MDFQVYELGVAVYEEMFRPDGAPKEHSLPLQEP